MMLIKFKKIRHILPIIFLAAAFLALVFFGLSRINRALAVAIPGSWLQTDSSALETGFNFTGNTKTQTGVRGTGDGAGGGVSFDSTWGTNWQSVTINDFYADSIAIDSVGNTIYTTGGNSYVRRFEYGGGSTTFGNSSQNFVSPGSGINQFSGPYDISIDTINNKVYVA